MILIVAIFVCLALLTIIGRFELLPVKTPKIDARPGPHQENADTLFIYLHGMERTKNWQGLQSVLSDHGNTLAIKYPVVSNADPLAVATGISRAIQQHFEGSPHQRIVLMGQSMGALLAKSAFLTGEGRSHTWTDRVQRVVLLAGMNRGWDISGQKPSDMGFGTWLQIWLGAWSARLAGFGKFNLKTETGAPFVVNLRIDWMNRMRAEDRRGIEVVQLLGDIDDLVSEEDNKDLRSIGPGRFAWVKVRGTGHGNIVDFRDTEQFGDVVLGEYRRRKFLLAATGDFDAVAGENEVQPFQPDEDVTHIVFVLHGIRDLGEWAAAFEQELQAKFKQHQTNGSTDKLAIASIRYGFFGMGPFLLRPIRQKYVKWFMDEYTEILARYPNAEEIHFVGHSNGTYLLAAALEQYDSLRVDRVVFGGSVVRRGYGWDEKFAKIPTLRVRNYVAGDDWVVALFPRFFEPKLVDQVLHNDIGSAGFNGFDSKHAHLSNVRYLRGGHGAFLDRIPEITDFILHGPESSEPLPASEEPQALLKWGSAWGTWLFVWPLLAAVVLYVGWHVIMSAPEPRFPFFLAYALLLFLILKNV